MNISAHGIAFSAYNEENNNINVEKKEKSSLSNELDKKTYQSTTHSENSIKTYFKDPTNNKDVMVSLDQVLEDYNEEYWLNRSKLDDVYPTISKKYLQFTSIEGGGSYFYDKETDYVYDVNWGQEEDMITEKLKPWFTSFYDFLEWYYSEEDE